MDITYYLSGHYEHKDGSGDGAYGFGDTLRSDDEGDYGTAAEIAEAIRKEIAEATVLEGEDAEKFVNATNADLHITIWRRSE